MPDKTEKAKHYRAYMKMYGEMIRDLSCCDDYVKRLTDQDKLSDFETALRTRIEKSPKH
ncbi:MAG: hypothetical protein K0U40_08595 [Betaproteobacteria bacterium]|nr:hypothetical protein [Betaproteobacteria bacterium]